MLILLEHLVTHSGSFSSLDDTMLTILYMLACLLSRFMYVASWCSVFLDTCLLSGSRVNTTWHPSLLPKNRDFIHILKMRFEIFMEFAWPWTHDVPWLHPASILVPESGNFNCQLSLGMEFLETNYSLWFINYFNCKYIHYRSNLPSQWVANCILGLERQLN